MNRSDLVIRLSTLSGMSLRHTEDIVDRIISSMSDTLAAGQRIEIRGFGSFDLSLRPGRIARNPKTGETFSLGSKYFPAFKAGKYLREELRGDGDDDSHESAMSYTASRKNAIPKQKLTPASIPSISR